jgi:two-component system, cell cycle sensor histidine kinase and response regulator CckA
MNSHTISRHIRIPDAPLRIALAYVAAGALWITVSDWLLHRLSPEQFWLGQGLKGVLFVLFSGSLIYYLVRRELVRRKRVQREREEMRRRLSGAQRLEAIGRLTAGIAHDFNNLLTAITGNIDGYMDRLRREGHPETELVELGEAASAARRAEDLTRQLMAFGRQQELRDQPLDLNALIHDMAHLLQRLIGDRIEIAVSLDDGLWAVSVDPAPLQQVVMNLALNARDAMPGGGRLRLATRNTTISDSEDDAAGIPLAPGHYVRLTVQDDGIGMDAVTRERIYEPFFTTKENHLGTGLGMSTVYGIVKQSGGHIALETAPGRGSRFDLYFPRGEGVPVQEGVTAPAAPEYAGSGTVLVVEDEPAVRSLIVRTLRRSGFSTLDCSDAAAALELLTSPSAPAIDLLLTDAIMPGMTGIELIRRVRSHRPALPVLLMSGYAETELAFDAPYLPKPFSTRALVSSVRQAMGPGRD